MTTAQISDALTDAELLLATITEIAERVASDRLDEDARADIAGDLAGLALAFTLFSEQVAA